MLVADANAGDSGLKEQRAAACLRLDGVGECRCPRADDRLPRDGEAPERTGAELGNRLIHRSRVDDLAGVVAIRRGLRGQFGEDVELLLRPGDEHGAGRLDRYARRR